MSGFDAHEKVYDPRMQWKRPFCILISAGIVVQAECLALNPQADQAPEASVIIPGSASSQVADTIRDGVHYPILSPAQSVVIWNVSSTATAI